MTDVSVSDGGRGDRVFGSEPVDVETCSNLLEIERYIGYFT